MWEFNYFYWELLVLNVRILFSANKTQCKHLYVILTADKIQSKFNNFYNIHSFNCFVPSVANNKSNIGLLLIYLKFLTVPRGWFQKYTMNIVCVGFCSEFNYLIGQLLCIRHWNWNAISAMAGKWGFISIMLWCNF